MLAATAWDDSDWQGAHARGWTVMGRLRARHDSLRNHAIQARRRIHERARKGTDLHPAATAGAERDAMRAGWRGGPTVLAFLFAHPDSHSIRTLDARGEYFNVRTGDEWDLFFPGYYRSDDPGLERQIGSRSVGRSFAEGWFFNASDFNMLRQHVESASRGRWAFSGGTDLVLINGWLPEQGEPVLDWASTKSGSIGEGTGPGKDVTIGHVIERISRDLETGAEDASYGVGDIVDRTPEMTDSDTKKVVIGALGGIAAALGKRGLGL